MTNLLDDDDDEFDDDDAWADDWYYAGTSDEIAELLLDKLNEKALTKTMWTRIIRILHEEFRHRFCEPVGVDEVTPATR